MKHIIEQLEQKRAAARLGCMEPPWAQIMRITMPLLRNAPRLARLLLACFALSLAVAMAAPLVMIPATQPAKRSGVECITTPA